MILPDSTKSGLYEALDKSLYWAMVLQHLNHRGICPMEKEGKTSEVTDALR